MEEIHLRVHMKSGVYHDVKFNISPVTFTQALRILHEQFSRNSYLVFDRYSKNFDLSTRIAIVGANVAAIEEI